jgi:hypothetical protein
MCVYVSVCAQMCMLDVWVDDWKMDGWMGGWMEEWMDGRVDGWMGGWMDGWAKLMSLCLVAQTRDNYDVPDSPSPLQISPLTLLSVRGHLSHLQSC